MLTPHAADYQVIRGTAGTDPQIAFTRYEPVTRSTATPLVLLNGVAHKQDCWHQWARYFAQRGTRCITLDYRGQGMSTWSEPVQNTTLDQKAADVATALEALGIDSRQATLIGHSLGGAVAQRFAEQHKVAGLVLMATLALGRWMPEVLAQMPGQVLKHPRVYPKLRTDPSALFTTVSLAREYLFDRTTPEETVQWYVERGWCHDSGRAMSDMIAARPLPLHAQLVQYLAGRQDASVSLRSIRASAAWAHVPLVELDVPHDGMLAGNWQGAAEVVLAFAQRVSAWLAEHNNEAAQYPLAGNEPAARGIR